jgi:hypothetical protein
MCGQLHALASLPAPPVLSGWVGPIAIADLDGGEEKHPLSEEDGTHKSLNMVLSECEGGKC